MVSTRSDPIGTSEETGQPSQDVGKRAIGPRSAWRVLRDRHSQSSPWAFGKRGNRKDETLVQGQHGGKGGL